MGRLAQEITISPAVGFTVAETKQGYNVDKPSNTFTQYPNSVSDTLSSQGLPLTAYLSPAEEKILNRCIRMANGYHRTKFRMSLSEMAQLTGLSKTGVVNCANSLALSGLVSYDASKGVGTWSVNLDVELALNYYVSQVRTTELYSNKKKVRTTELVKRATELYDKGQTVQLSGTPSIKERISKEIKETTTTSPSKSDVPFLESEADSEFLAELKRLHAINDELSETNPAISQEIQAKELNANTVTLGAVAVPPPSAAQNTPPAIDPRVVAYCNALGWHIDGKGVMAKASATVNELCAFFGDTLTGEDMAAALAHLKSLGVKMDKRSISLKFGEAVQDVGIMTNSRNKSLVEAIKVMYGQTKGVEYRLEFEYSKLASRMAQQGVTPEMIKAFPAIWESNYNGYSLPGYDNLKLITNIKNMTMKAAPSTKVNPQGFSQSSNFQINQSKLDRLTV